jgi:NAD-dependent SIR2 family protein deacetylase
VWTREKQGLGLQLLPGDVPFDEASPSLTHMAILGLVRSGHCKFVVSQNVDGLHLRSGMPPDKLAELHGNIFEEQCGACHRVYFRNFDVGGCGFKSTPRRCDDCGGELFDLVLDWEDALPERDFKLARQHALLADVSLALGTSMRVHPAATIPLLTVDKSQRLHSSLSNVAEERIDSFEGVVTDEEAKRLLAMKGSLAIVNLQSTPHDNEATVRVHGRCDRVMKELMRRLQVPIPDFVRVETYYVQQNERRQVRVSSDVFVGNCLFAASLAVTYEDSVTVLTAPQEQWMVDCSHVPVGGVVRLLLRLNANATLEQVCLSHTVTAEAGASQREFEVVRKSFPIGGEDGDDEEWLERDAPPPPAAVPAPEPKRKRAKKEKNKPAEDVKVKIKDEN